MQLFYTVRQGDTLYQISSRWKLPVESVIAANNLSPPYTIYIGQQLAIPPGVDLIRVKSGDSVYSIAQSYRIPTTVIIEANRLIPPYIIQAGQLLRVPPGVLYYVVQPGDSLYQIARRFNVVTAGQSNHELIRIVNRLSSNVIFPGQQLMIPYAPTGETGLIAYTSNRNGRYDIWLYNLMDGGNSRLTTGLADSYSVPFWSPDSRKIAFVGENAILYTVNVANGATASIDQFTEGLGIYLDWSPNSEKLVYVKQNKIILYNPITHKSESLNEPGASDVQWFPNGRELLYQALDEAGISQLYRIGADGSGKRQLTRNSGGRLNHVRLSSDGLFALYTTPGASISLIYTINLSTGNIYELKGGHLAKNYEPIWSPDSNEVAYSATAFDDRGYFSLIRTSGRQGENDRTVAISNCFSTPLTWSPDSRKVAYLSGCFNQGSSREIWMLNLEHPVPIRLTEAEAITALQWSPSASSPLKKDYLNPVYHVQFQYPAHWQKVNDERYEGADGFFQIGAISSEGSIHEVCQTEVFHQLMPYGTNPSIMATEIQNQEACIILPSRDQPIEMRAQAAMIVRYSIPVQIGGTSYQFFILWTDKSHINEITTTLSFIE